MRFDAHFFGAQSFVNAAEQKKILIGTGGKTGVYYVVSNSICRMVNSELRRQGMRCDHREGGSVRNINEVHSGEVDIVLICS
ncbi:TAXI family TRAP transporter solute-binding subunit [Solemya velesiana gill symbiont]|uniref:TAXI family TRAP transporter solute-binding subunit n=1 Tax=Solemya velesiana gill symbiont TaxID=1918948 RepID=UPI0009988C24